MPSARKNINDFYWPAILPRLSGLRRCRLFATRSSWREWEGNYSLKPPTPCCATIRLSHWCANLNVHSNLSAKPEPFDRIRFPSKCKSASVIVFPTKSSLHPTKKYLSWMMKFTLQMQ